MLPFFIPYQNNEIYYIAQRALTLNSYFWVKMGLGGLGVKTMFYIIVRNNIIKKLEKMVTGKVVNSKNNWKIYKKRPYLPLTFVPKKLNTKFHQNLFTRFAKIALQKDGSDLIDLSKKNSGNQLWSWFTLRPEGGGVGSTNFVWVIFKKRIYICCNTDN